MPAAKSFPEARLKVCDMAQREDFGAGIARISKEKLDALSAEEGDIIEIRGRRLSCAVAMEGLPSDSGTDTIRIDGLLRRNCDANTGEYVYVKKIKPKDAKNITLAVTRKGLTIHLTGEDLNRSLLMRAMKSGDIIIPNPIPRKDDVDAQRLLGSELGKALFTSSFEERFAVTSTQPEGIVRVIDSTRIELVTEPYTAITELEEAYQQRVINVKKCPDLKAYIELKGMDDIKKFITAGNLVSRYEDENSVIYFVSSYFFKIHKTGF